MRSIFLSNHIEESAREVSVKEQHLMNSKQEPMPTSYANPAFDEEPNGVRNSAGPSPMGSNIFIVKPDDSKNSRAHPQPFRNDPVTSNNIGRMILRGIRCRICFNEDFFHLPLSLSLSVSTLGNTTNGKRSSKEQRSVCENNNTRIDSLLGFHHHSMHQ